MILSCCHESSPGINAVTSTTVRVHSVPRYRGCVKKKMVPTQFPTNMMEMLYNWQRCPDENVVWCLLCDGPIRSAQDLIPNSNTHNCLAGLKLGCSGIRARTVRR